MAFFIVEVDNTGFKVLNTAGAEIDPATQATAAAIQSALEAIRDTAGIKKIVDALPAGSNQIGAVSQGTKAAGAGAWPTVLYDAAGNAVAVVSDSGVYRIRVDAKLMSEGGAVGAPIPSRAVGVGGEDPSGNLKVFKLGSDGTLAVSSTPTPASLSAIRNAYCAASGGSVQLFANGSVTPIEYTYAADPSMDTRIYEIKFIVNATDIQFNGVAFCKVNTTLTNGVKVEVTTGGVTTELMNLKISEDFLAFSGFGGGGDFLDQTDTSDVMTSTLHLGGGVVLEAGSADSVKVTIRDNLVVAGNLLMRCLVKGNKV